jgi:hypothetical protein
MVSNEEISQRLRNKREGKAINGYLICNNCGGYYELQAGESPEDFDLECDCGGRLIQNTTDSLLPPEEYLSEEEYEHRRYGTEIVLAYVTLILFAVAAPVMGIYLITRDNKRAKFHGKIVLFLSLGLFFIVFGIEALLVYSTYMP